MLISDCSQKAPLNSELQSRNMGHIYVGLHVDSTPILQKLHILSTRWPRYGKKIDENRASIGSGSLEVGFFRAGMVVVRQSLVKSKFETLLFPSPIFTVEKLSATLMMLKSTWSAYESKRYSRGKPCFWLKRMAGNGLVDARSSRHGEERVFINEQILLIFFTAVL